MLGQNGGLIGVQRTAGGAQAAGVWFSNEQALYAQDNAWMKDQYFANVSLLLHANGSNGSSSFIDSSLNNFAITVGGSTIISTVQSKFGSSSAYFDGTSDYLQIPSNTAFDFGTLDLTIECWVRIVSFANTPILWSQRANGGITWRLNTTGTMSFFYGENNGTFTTTTTVATNTWTHLALTREGNVFKMWINGRLEAVNNIITVSMPSGANARIGQPTSIEAEYMNGYIDEFRVTKGIARYIMPFDVPTTPYPDNNLAVL